MKFLVLSILILTAAISSGCSADQKNIELNIPESKMVDIMLDLRIIENQINKHHVLERDSVSTFYRNMLLEIHDIDSVSLMANLAVLQQNPRLAKSIEDGVLKRIATLQDTKQEDYD